jgi:hypothetical protein
MTRIDVYAYVDGSDLDDVFALIESEGHRFLVSRAWSVPARLVSTHFCRTPDLRPDDLSDWKLGFNLDIPNDPTAYAAAYEDVRAIAQFVARLHASSGREFVFGIFDHDTGIDEDFTFIGNNAGKIEVFVDALKHALLA